MNFINIHNLEVEDIAGPKDPAKAEITITLSQDYYTCSICFSEYTISETMQTCLTKHRFCKTCLELYLQSLIDNFKVYRISCPQADCQESLKEDQIQELLDEECFQKYQTRLLTKLMNRDINIKFCPKSGCSRAFSSIGNQQYTTCQCGTQICNICGSFFHEGKTCLNVIDSEFERFSKENEVRFCVMCKSLVQRVEGCSHITCPVCDYDWCWMCGREFTTTHQRRCPREWKPEPPKRVMRDNSKLNTIQRLQKIKALRPFFCILSFLLIIFLLPTHMFRLWDQFLIIDSLGGRIFIVVYGIMVSLAYNMVIISLVMAILEEDDPLPVIIILFILLLLSFIMGWRTFRRRSALTIFASKRWLSRNPQNFQYTSSARPVAIQNTQTNISNNDNNNNLNNQNSNDNQKQNNHQNNHMDTNDHQANSLGRQAGTENEQNEIVVIDVR
jgi:hypothetical protein